MVHDQFLSFFKGFVVIHPMAVLAGAISAMAAHPEDFDFKNPEHRRWYSPPDS